MGPGIKGQEWEWLHSLLITLSDSLGTHLLHILLTSGSACLEFLFPMGIMLSPGGITAIHPIELVVKTASKPLLALHAFQSTGEDGYCTHQSD